MMGISEAPPRRLDLKREAARLGLLRGPRPAGVESRPRLDRLGELLAGIGPLGLAFGHYLSRRSDLDYFSESERRILATSWTDLETHRNDDPNSDLEATLAHLAAALGSEVELLADISRQPEIRDWSGQWHRGRCVDGRAVRIFIGRPELAGEIEEASDRLEEMAGLIGLPAAVVGDFFRHVVRPRADLHRRKEWFERLRRMSSSGQEKGESPGRRASPIPGVEFPGLDAANLGVFSHRALQIPAVIKELTLGPVLTLEDPPGVVGLLSGGPLSARGVEAARLLASSFIELLAEHGAVADEIYLARLEDGRPWLLDATFVEISAPSARRILEFFRATAGERPRDVAEVWRPEVEESGVDPAFLRSKLRQATPRRGGAERARESTLEYAVAFWRAAALGGVAFGPSWRAVLPAALAVERRLVEWDPEDDALAAALIEESWRQGWRRFRDLATPLQIASMLERHATAFLEAPQIIDRALAREAGSERPGGGASKSPRRLRSSRLRASLPFLPALLAVSLVARHFPEVPAVEPVATGLFMILAISLLRVLLR